MTILKIRTWPDPILSERCAVVTDFNAELERLAEDMLETMEHHGGLGLAAPQVGRAIRMFVVSSDAYEDIDGPYVFVNPMLILGKKTVKDTEGCLSFPGASLEGVIRSGPGAGMTYPAQAQRPAEERLVERATKVLINARDEFGERVAWKATGLAARVMQHEADHLRGVCFNTLGSTVGVL